MYFIRITGKHKMKNGLTRCWCNGLRLTGREEEVKNSCRMMKMTGLMDVTLLNHALTMYEMTNKALKVDLPEWGSEVLDTVEEMITKVIEKEKKLGK